MTILFVWAYGRVLDPTLCLFTEVAATLWRHHGLETFSDLQTFAAFTKEKGIFSGVNQNGPIQCGGSGQGGTFPRWETLLSSNSNSKSTGNLFTMARSL